MADLNVTPLHDLFPYLGSRHPPILEENSSKNSRIAYTQTQT